MLYYVICYALITLQNMHTIRVRHPAHACTRLERYMIFNCMSGSSPLCDCGQNITVEKRKKMDAFLELKVLRTIVQRC